MNGGWHSFSTLPPPDPSVVRRALKRGPWTTHEERNLLRMKSEGLLEAEVAARLFRSIPSVRNHFYQMKNPAPASDSRILWGATEEEEFRILIGHMSMRLIAVRLNRSLESVKSKKLRMTRVAGNERAGKRVYRPWTDMERTELISLWPILPTVEIAKRLNRSYRAVYAKACGIGLPERHKL